MKTRNKIVLLLLGLTLFFALIGYNMAMQIEQYNYYTMGMAGYSVLEWNFDISLLLTTVFGFLTLVGTIVCLIFREVDRKIERAKITCIPDCISWERWWKNEEKGRRDEGKP
jgi:hypothetical protein